MTLRPSLLRWILVLAGSLAFVAVGVFMTSKPGHVVGWTGIASMAFFGLGALVAFVNLIPGASYLRLDAQGFEMRSLYRSHKTAWSDVSGFGIMRVGTRSMIGWNYAAGRGKLSRLRKFNLDKFGFEAALPDTYGKKPQELADLLESLRSGRSSGG